ncbi:MAG: ABC transporter ATP-binding protein [Myxococcales bacterium]|nr:ABC transporter ATP-binding protein [Myxococcales bacterium]
MGDSQVRALDGVSVEIGSGEFVAIMGASGSGKSTLMNVLGCLDRPTAGSYALASHEVSRLNRKMLASVRNKLIGFVFQSFNLLPRTTAVDNVSLPLLYAGVYGREAERRAVAALETVGLGKRLDHKPSELSGGQQQRVAIARALITEPRLILADEPTGNLDSRTTLEIMALFQSLGARGITIVFVTHEPEIAQFASRLIVMRDGKVIADKKQTPAVADPDADAHAAAPLKLVASAGGAA